jgi:hypothetical protein
MEGTIGLTDFSQSYFPGNISYFSERLEKATAAEAASSKHKTAVDLNLNLNLNFIELTEGLKEGYESESYQSATKVPSAKLQQNFFLNQEYDEVKLPVSEPVVYNPF